MMKEFVPDNWDIVAESSATLRVSLPDEPVTVELDTVRVGEPKLHIVEPERLGGTTVSVTVPDTGTLRESFNNVLSSLETSTERGERLTKYDFM